MKIKVMCTGQAEEIRMVKIPMFDNKTGDIKWELVNFGGRQLPF